MKPGRIVILLAGRHAGKKAIIVRQHDEGKKVRLFVFQNEFNRWLFRRRSSLTPLSLASRDIP